MLLKQAAWLTEGRTIIQLRDVRDAIHRFLLGARCEAAFDKPATKASDESVPASDAFNASIFGNREPSALPSARNPGFMTKES